MRVPSYSVLLTRCQAETFECVALIISANNALTHPEYLVYITQLTTYTALMQVSKGTLETYIRLCPHPCWLW